MMVDREDEDGQLIEGDWRKDESLNLSSVPRTSSNMYGRNAEKIRVFK